MCCRSGKYAQVRRRNFAAESLAITFDDGYADNCLLAQPVLESLGLPATIFVATAYLDGGIMFNDMITESIRQYDGSKLRLQIRGLRGSYDCENSAARRGSISKILTQIKYLPRNQRTGIAREISKACNANLPRDLMMTTAQLKRISAKGIDIGGHTHHHPILKGLERQSAIKEIETGRKYLEAVLSKKVDLFAYPNGVPGETTVSSTRPFLPIWGLQPLYLQPQGFLR